MCEDVEFLIEKLSNQATTNICTVSNDGKCCRIKRDTYYPNEEGVITFKRQTDWSAMCYSVGEMLEFLKKYGEKATNIMFEDYQGIPQHLQNVFEIDNIGDEYEYDCLIIVGEEDKIDFNDFHISVEKRTEIL